MSDQRPVTFGEILDACLGDIASGRRSVEECLLRHLELRDELEPLLRAAAEMRQLPRYEERSPDPARRTSLLAELASTPQQSSRWLRWPRFGLPALGPMARGLAYAAPAAVFIVFALLLFSGRESSTAQASSLAVYSGAVERLNGDEWRALADDSELGEGDRLRTTGEGRALITFIGGSTVALEPGTELVLLRVRSDDGVRTIELEQVSGALWSHVLSAAPTEGASYLVRTPDALVRADGTAFSTEVRPGETEVTAAEGSVDVEANGERVTLEASESVVARASTDQRLTARTPTEASTLTIDAPFAASVVSQHGQATGVQPEGDVHLHLPGATTTMPDIRGPQQLRFLAGFPPGEYTLILRRFDDGEGALVIRDANGTVHRVPIDRDVNTELRLVVRVTRTDGAVNIEVLAADARPAPADVTETLPTPRPEPTSAATDRPTATATAATDFSSAREELVRRLGAEYLATLASALQSGDAEALTQALRAATEGDAAVAKLLVLREQLQNRTIQLRIIQVLGLRASLPLSLWLDQGEGNLERLRAAILVALDRAEADSPLEDPAGGTSDAPTRDDAR